LFTSPCEGGLLTEDSISRVNTLCASFLCCLNDGLNVEITSRGDVREGIRNWGDKSIGSIPVRRRIDRRDSNPMLGSGSMYTESDLAAVCYEDRPERLCGWSRNGGEADMLP